MAWARVLRNTAVMAATGACVLLNTERASAADVTKSYRLSVVQEKIKSAAQEVVLRVEEGRLTAGDFFSLSPASVPIRPRKVKLLAKYGYLMRAGEISVALQGVQFRSGRFLVGFKLSEDGFGFGSHASARCIELRRSDRRCRLTIRPFKIRGYQIPRINAAIPDLLITMRDMQIVYVVNIQRNGEVQISLLKSRSKAALKSCAIDFWATSAFGIDSEAEYFCGLMMNVGARPREIANWMNKEIVGAFAHSAVRAEIGKTIGKGLYDEFSKVSSAAFKDGSLVVTGTE